MRSSAAVPWDRFLAPGSAPRRIGALPALRVAFGGGPIAVAWAIAAFGAAFFWAFDVPAVVADLVARPDDLVAVQVTVTGSRTTNLEINEVDVYAHDLRFVVDGVERSAVVYTTGRGPGPGTYAARASRSQPLVVLPGTRPTRMNHWGLLILLVPGCALAFVAGIVRRHLRGLALLRTGRRARGRLLRTEATRVKINNRPVLAYVFAFTDDRGRAREAVAKTHAPDALRDDVDEPIVYDDDRAVLLGSLPGDPRVQDDGSVAVGGSWQAPALLLPPALFAAVNAIGAALSG